MGEEATIPAPHGIVEIRIHICGDRFQSGAVGPDGPDVVTPGPIGINIATYVGFDQFGIPGALIATISFIIPSFLIVSVLSDLLKKYRYSPIVKNWFLYLKASIIGLIGYAFVNVADYALFQTEEWIDLKALILLVGLSVVYYFLRKKPWIVIIIGGVCGALFL